MPAPVNPLPAEDLDHVLTHTRDLWTEARGQSFFITGGTGFFGMWLLESFARANDVLSLGMRAVVLTRTPGAFARKAPHLVARNDLEFIQGDLRTFTFPPGRFTYLIHAAADTEAWTKGQGAAGVVETVVADTRHLLDFAASAGVKNILLVSSGGVYGRQPTELAELPEEYPGAPDPLLPSSAWGEGKRVAEHLGAIHAARHGSALRIARCFCFVGPHLPLTANYAIGNFIRDALGGDSIQVEGDGTPIRSYLYASDLAVWLWTILFRGRSGRAYNVGSPAGLSIAALADTVRRVVEQDAPVKIRLATAPGTPVSRYVPAVARARQELGLQVNIPLDEAIRKTFAWYRAESRQS